MGAIEQGARTRPKTFFEVVECELIATVCESCTAASTSCEERKIEKKKRVATLVLELWQVM
jgi:MinD superfamily P-loop ATPase